MSSKVVREPKKEKHSRPKPMSKADVFQKIVADQKFLEKARQKGISYQELREKYGYSFATI